MTLWSLRRIGGTVVAGVGFTCGVAVPGTHCPRVFPHGLGPRRLVSWPGWLAFHWCFYFILFISYFLLFKPPLLPLPHTLPLPAPPWSILISLSGKPANYFSNSSESKPQTHSHGYLRSPNFLESFIVSLASFYVVLVIKLGERHFYFLSPDSLII